MKRNIKKKGDEMYILDTTIGEPDLSKIRKGRFGKNGTYDAEFVHSSVKGTAGIPFVRSSTSHMCLDYHMIIDKNGETVHMKRYEIYPKSMVIANCGYPEQSHFRVLHLLFERIARNFHSQIIAEIYRGQGELLGVEHPRLEPVVSAYMSLLQKAGEEIVKNLKLSEETITALDQPLVPHDLYRKGVNEGLSVVMSGE